MTEPFRRRFRFSLRTLLVVVTVLCVWLGWQVNVVEERKSVRAWLDGRGDGIFVFPGVHRSWNVTSQEPIPFVRRWLGDQPVDVVSFQKPLSKKEFERVRAAFPHAATGGWVAE